MSALGEIKEAVNVAADQVGPSVVSIGRHGAGIVVGSNLVATNAHNLRGGEVHVTFGDGRTSAATLAGADVDGDLAVLSVETAGIPAVAWAESAAELGDVVIALANPRGRGLRASVGTISAVGRSFRGPRGRRISGGLEHTAPLARGSSGGPIVDTSGRVVGVSTHRLEDGFYVAVGAGDDLAGRIAGLSTGESPQRRRLGAAIAPPQAARHLRSAAGLPEVEGLLVRGVEEGSAADRAGLRRGDVLVAVAGELLTSVDALYRALDGEGGELEFTVARAADEVVVTVRFEAPATEGEGPGA
jgi:serine protease Do